MNSYEKHSLPDWRQKHGFGLPISQASFRLSAAMLAVTLAVGTFAQDARADDDDEGDEVIPFSDVGIIFETNFTDRDTGIQISLDGEPWKEIEVEGPDGKLVEVENDNNLEKFGLTELFFESNEPNYDDLPLAAILALFPEGDYEFEGETVEGDELVGEATLTHVLPCGPDVSAIVSGADDVTITWERVTTVIDPSTEMCMPDIYGELTIEGYQVIVENDNTFQVTLEPDEMEVTIPPQFLDSGTEYKFEVLAIEESGNQTITESEFETP